MTEILRKESDNLTQQFHKLPLAEKQRLMGLAVTKNKNTMKKEINALLKKLTPEIREAVTPFLDEYIALSKGEKHQVKAYFGYTKSGVPETELLIDATFKWDEDIRAQFTWKLKKQYLIPCYASDKAEKPKQLLGSPDELCCFLVENSPQYAAFNQRIQDFVEQTEQVGRKKFKDKDALWSEFFWDASLNFI